VFPAALAEARHHEERTVAKRCGNDFFGFSMAQIKATLSTQRDRCNQRLRAIDEFIV
jgi:hypothetical protein